MHCSNISKTASWGVLHILIFIQVKECVSGLWVRHKARVALTCVKYLNWWGISHLLAKKIQVVPLDQLTQTDVSVSPFLSLRRQKLGFHCCPQWLWAAATGACWEPVVFVHRRANVSTPWKGDGSGRTAYTPSPRWGGARWGSQEVN